MCVCGQLDGLFLLMAVYEIFAFICLEHRPHTSVTVCLHRNIKKCGIIIGLISIDFFTSSVTHPMPSRLVAR